MTVSEQAAALHRRVLVVEGHRDVYEQMHHHNRGRPTPWRDLIQPRLRQGGVDLTVFACCGDTIDHANGTDRPMWAAMEHLDQFYREAEQPGSGMKVVLSCEDVPDEPDGNLHVLLAFEGGKALEGSVAALRNFYRLGLRSIQPVHNLRNELGDGVSERISGGGLTRAGEAVVREMNRLGMVIDLSHASEATFYHVLRVSEKPVVVSHSNCSSVSPHVRNLTDDQLRAMRDNGGLVGIAMIPDFIDEHRLTVDRVVDHLDHMVEFVGPDHVYLGCDFSKYDNPRSPRELMYGGQEDLYVEGVEEIDQLPTLTEGFLRRGYSEADLAMILGGSFIRFLKQTLRSRDDQMVAPPAASSSS